MREQKGRRGELRCLKSCSVFELLNQGPAEIIPRIVYGLCPTNRQDYMEQLSHVTVQISTKNQTTCRPIFVVAIP